MGSIWPGSGGQDEKAFYSVPYLAWSGREDLRTYMKVFFNSEGASPAEVVEKMKSMGWKTVVGDYDFVWEGGVSDSVGDQ